jgi:succinyl-diaminopimelate desuccinylase
VNLIATPAVRRGPGCGIYVHTDTVPPGEGWTRPPLALTREGDFLFGRGAADMKGTIAAMLAALGAAQQAGCALAADPVLLFCSDEEGGLYPGVRYLAEQRLLGCEQVICLNGGAVPRIWAGCFGSLDIAITVEGRAAHSGDPGPLGVNAVEQALPVLQALMELKERVQARTSVMPAPPHFAGRKLAARLTLAAVQGGAKGSALPGQCRILVNRRVMPEETMEAAQTEIEEAVAAGRARSQALSITTQLVGRLDPVVDPDAGGTRWARWQAALSWGFSWRSGDFARYGSSTSSDMGFVQRAGVAEILLGGLSRPDNRTHGPDEFTTIQDVTALARALLAYLADAPIPGGDPA